MNDSTKARACLQQIVDLFQSGSVPQALAVATIPPQSGIPSANWSWSNRLLQFLADTSDARGYRQWQEAGRDVTKGAKAFHILGPKTRKIKKLGRINDFMDFSFSSQLYLSSRGTGGPICGCMRHRM